MQQVIKIIKLTSIILATILLVRYELQRTNHYFTLVTVKYEAVLYTNKCKAPNSTLQS